MINDHGTACQCSQCQMHVQPMSTTADRPSLAVEASESFKGIDADEYVRSVRDGTYTPPVEPKCPFCPHPAHGEICNEYPDGFRCKCEGEPKCERCGKALFWDGQFGYRDCSHCQPATPEPAESEIRDRIKALDAELIADGVTMITHKPAAQAIDRVEEAKACELCGHKELHLACEYSCDECARIEEFLSTGEYRNPARYVDRLPRIRSPTYQARGG